MEKISGGSARGGQLMQLIFFTPFTLILLYINIVNFSVGLLGSSFIFIGIMTIFFYQGYSYSDLYLCEDYLISKKIFRTKKSHLNDILEINRALIPFTYYIKFKDNYTVYFTSKFRDIPKLFFSLDSEKGLNMIKSILLRNKSPDLNNNKTKC